MRATYFKLFVLVVTIGLPSFVFSQNTSSLPPIPTSEPASSQPITIDLTSRTGVNAFIKVIDSCNHNYAGVACVNMRSGPGTEYEVVKKVRNGEVYKIDQMILSSKQRWYRISYADQHLYYPERITSKQYVSGDFVKIFTEAPEVNSWTNGNQTDYTKRIVVDLSEQKLYAYEGDRIFLETLISTGNELSPTEIGNYTVFKKMPSRYMQGPLPNSDLEDEYDLSGVPWNMYFTADGAVIHGAYWHHNFGNIHSHGCVNLPPFDAEVLYSWAPLGTTITVQE